jgi:hypothetical protein
MKYYDVCVAVKVLLQLSTSLIYMYIGSTLYLVINAGLQIPHRWCNGKRTCLECGRSWVRDPDPGQTKDYEIDIC